MSALLAVVLAWPVSAPCKDDVGSLVVVLRLDSSGRPSVVSAREVGAKTQRRRGRAPATGFRVLGLDRNGKTVWTMYLQDPAVLRAEFHGKRPGDTIQGRTIRRKGPVVFTVRLPAVGIEQLSVERLRDGATADDAKKAASWIRLGTVDLPEGTGR